MATMSVDLSLPPAKAGQRTEELEQSMSPVFEWGTKPRFPGPLLHNFQQYML